jgi:hypothetical protein
MSATGADGRLVIARLFKDCESATCTGAQTPVLEATTQMAVGREQPHTANECAAHGLERSPDRWSGEIEDNKEQVRRTHWTGQLQLPPGS